MKKVIISESVLVEYSTPILSPSTDHPSFAKIIAGESYLWTDFGQELALKVFKLTLNDLIEHLGKNKYGKPNGQINWYKVEKPGFVPTGYRNDPNDNAPGFVVKETGTFGFNITKDVDKLDVVFGNSFIVNGRRGNEVDWTKHLRAWIKDGVKAYNSNHKTKIADFFQKLSDDSGYDVEYVKYLAKTDGNWSFKDLTNLYDINGHHYKNIFKTEDVYLQAKKLLNAETNIKTFNIPIIIDYIRNLQKETYFEDSIKNQKYKSFLNFGVGNILQILVNTFVNTGEIVTGNELLKELDEILEYKKFLNEKDFKEQAIKDINIFAQQILAFEKLVKK